MSGRKVLHREDTGWRDVIEAAGGSNGPSLPTADWTASGADRAGHFDASQSFSTNGPITSYAWLFGTAGPFITTEPTYDYTFPVDSTYDVVCSVTDSTGATASRTKTIIAPIVGDGQNRAPVAQFGLLVDELSVAVDGRASFDPDGAVVSWAWSFGDGASATGVDAEHTYAQPGAYTIALTILDNRGVVDRTARTITAALADVPVGEPTGAGIVSYSTLTGATFVARTNSASSGQEVSLPVGSYSFTDFASHVSGFDVGADLAVAGVLGSGIDHSILQMQPNTSSKAGEVPGIAGSTSTANPLYLVRLSEAGAQLANLTIRATEQGHPYGGVRLQQVSSPRLAGLKLVGIPGGPAEQATAALSAYRPTQLTASRVEIDGAGVGTTGLELLSSVNGATISELNAHDLKWGAGLRFAGHNGGAQLTDCRFAHCATGVLLERTTGTVTLTRPIFNGNGVDLAGGNDQSSALTVVITDPILIGRDRIWVNWFATENGRPNLIGRRNVKVLIGGVDRSAEFIQWIGVGAG